MAERPSRIHGPSRSGGHGPTDRPFQPERTVRSEPGASRAGSLRFRSAGAWSGLRLWGMALALVSAGLLSAGGQRAGAAVMGAAPARPLNEAIARTRVAAKAVLARSGDDSCLMGKLTNALLGLSSSCQAEGLGSPLCRLAEEVVVSTGWTMPFMDRSARALLELSDPSQTETP